MQVDAAEYAARLHYAGTGKAGIDVQIVAERADTAEGVDGDVVTEHVGPFIAVEVENSADRAQRHIAVQALDAPHAHAADGLQHEDVAVGDGVDLAAVDVGDDEQVTRSHLAIVLRVDDDVVTGDD